MNGIIHQCKQGNKNEENMVSSVLQYVDELVNIVRPTKRLFMAVV